jgi:hypothetical protein
VCVCVCVCVCDWLRRCQYLAHRAQLGELDKVKWGEYAARNLRKMLRFLETGPAQIDAGSCASVQARINSALKLRPSYTGKQTKSKPFIRIEWRDHIMRRLGLRNVLLKPEVKALLPGSVRSLMDDLVIAKKLVRPIGATVLNYSRTARDMHLHVKAADKTCACRRLFPMAFRPEGACVQTGDLSIVKDERLQKLLSYGPHFREPTSLEPLEAVEQGLDEFISYYSAKNDLDSVVFDDWRDAVLDHCTSVMPKQPGRRQPILADKAVRRYLQFLQTHLVLVPVDKAASNIAFVCKLQYCQRRSCHKPLGHMQT